MESLSAENWRTKLPLLSCGFMTPHDGKLLIEEISSNLSLDVVEALHGAMRSMTVALISGRTPSWRVAEWAGVLKSLITAVRKRFPVTAEKFVSLRCMLLEAGELADLKDTDLPERHGVAELVSLLESEDKPLSADEISVALGTSRHATAKGIQLALASGSVVADYGDWKTIRFSSPHHHGKVSISPP